MPQIRGSELLILVLLIVVLFGAKRLPDAARGIGRSLRIFKAETKGLTDSDDQQPSAAIDQGQASTEPATGTGPAAGIDATGQPTVGQEIPKPPTNQA